MSLLLFSLSWLERCCCCFRRVVVVVVSSLRCCVVSLIVVSLIVVVVVVVLFLCFVVDCCCCFVGRCVSVCPTNYARVCPPVRQIKPVLSPSPRKGLNRQISL